MIGNWDFIGKMGEYLFAGRSLGTVSRRLGLPRFSEPKGGCSISCFLSAFGSGRIKISEFIRFVY